MPASDRLNAGRRATASVRRFGALFRINDILDRVVPTLQELAA
jgi:hypothetical protein